MAASATNSTLNATIEARAPATNDAARIAAEKEQKERALQEKLDKRSAVIVVVLRKFITSFYAGRQQMLDEARAAEARKKAGGKKAKKKKGAAAKAADNKKDSKAATKKPAANPVQLAWQSFLADMDDRINKQKRFTLDDLYRGVVLLTAREQVALQAILTTTTAKMLPAAMNLNLMNIKEALQAGTAAVRLGVSTALPADGAGTNPGLAALRDRGASCQQLLQHGFGCKDALRSGLPRSSVIAAHQHDLGPLRPAGITAAELLTCPEAPQLACDLTHGADGIGRLRHAGYTALELLSGGLNNTWDLAQGGYSLQELLDCGITDPHTLRAAGFGHPSQQPTTFLSSTLGVAAKSTPVDMIPPPNIGTLDPVWKELLAGQAVVADNIRTTRRTPAGSRVKVAYAVNSETS